MPGKQSHYKHVQFIAHSVYTGPRVTAWGKVTGNVWKATKQEYVGVTSEAEDGKARVAVVKKALTLAKEKANPSYDVLKIFMMPEFFFRGKAGAYTLDKTAYTALKQLIGAHKNRATSLAAPQFPPAYVSTDALLSENGLVKQLQALVRNPDWRDWIFVFGTLVGVYPTTGTPQEVVNFALIQEGGYDEMIDMAYQSYSDEMKLRGVKQTVKLSAFAKGKDDLFTHIVQKKNLSDGDFIKGTDASSGQPGYLVENVKHAAAEPDGEANFVFTMKGMTFGLEICTDHFQSVLKKLKPPSTIDIQLVPSAGSTITAPASIVLQNGYIFNCDGAKLEKKAGNSQLQPTMPVYNEPEDTIVNCLHRALGGPDDTYRSALRGERPKGDDLYGELGEMMEDETIAQLNKSHSQVIGVIDGKLQKGIRRQERVTVPHDVTNIFAGDAGYLHVYEPAVLPVK